MDIKEKTQSKLLFLFVLGIVFVIIAVCRFTNTPLSIRADTKEPVVCVLNTPAVTVKEPEKIECPPLEPEPNLLEPILPTPEVTLEAPRVEAICVSGSGKSSIFVRGNFAYEGDVVDGFKILKIYPNKVEFEKDGITITAVFPRP